MRKVFELFKFIAMTFEQLKENKLLAERTIEECEERIKVYRDSYAQCEEEYIREHLPFPYKERQRVVVTLRVTEETVAIRRRVDEVVGTKYQVAGIVTRYSIGDKGELRPNFWGVDGWYPSTDEVVSIELDVQSDGRCGTCRYYRPGGCYETGGDKPVFATEQDAYICGYYRDKGE